VVSYYLEKLTDQMEAAALRLHRQDRRHGRDDPRHRPRHPQKEIADAAVSLPASWTDAARRWWWGRQQVRHARRQAIKYLRSDEQVEVEQIERVSRFKAARDATRVERRRTTGRPPCRNRRERYAGPHRPVKDM